MEPGEREALPTSAEQGQSIAADAAALAALEAFVVDNDDLLSLESHIGRFNIFDALGIARVEIRHSNFLAFILDPAESHGQGQLFLKAILMDLLKAAPAGSRPLSPIDLDGIDLRGVEVRREWEHIDILITCQQPPFVVAIENKVDAHEHSDQLRRYKEKVRQHHPQPALFVYLTLPDADDPSDSDWMQYSYADIHDALTRVLATYRKAIGEDVLVFLDHYLSLLGTLFMSDEKIDELCRRIYKNHRQALELIFERGKPMSGVLAEAEDVLNEDPRWEVVAGPSQCIDFLPKAWLEWLPPLGLKGNVRAWIHVRLRSDEARLDYSVEMTPMTDQAKRINIVSELRAKCSEFGFKPGKAKEVKNGQCRISAVQSILEWPESHEPEAEKIHAAVKQTLDTLYPKLEKLALVLKPLCKLPASPT